MSLVPALILEVVSIFNIVEADRIARRAQRQWSGRRIPGPLVWVLGSPASAARIRKVNIASAVLFGALLLIGAATT